MGRANVDDPDTQFAGERFGGQVGSTPRAQRTGADCIIEVCHGPSLALAVGEGTGPLALPLRAPSSEPVGILQVQWPAASSARGVMGTSKRYAAHFDRLMDDRLAQNAMRDHEPDSLAGIELELETEPLTRAPVPRPVSAWVRYGTTSLNVDAVAVAWTDYAVAIKWPTLGGEHHAWVWASAVRSRKPVPVNR